MKLLMKNVMGLCILIFFAQTAFSQSAKQKEDEYTKVITVRADKIVANLGISDSGKYNKVRDIIVNQYRSLSNHHDGRAENIKAIKSKYSTQKDLRDEKIKEYEQKEDKALRKIHKSYIAKLSKQLNAAQLEQVKDGMTYGVLPITIKAYNEMLPQLTQEQKSTILSYLTEARELAMDAAGSKEKHHVFGKYKGKINNYLSGQGINMKKAGEEWQQRIKNAKNNKK